MSILTLAACDIISQGLPSLMLQHFVELHSVHLKFHRAIQKCRMLSIKWKFSKVQPVLNPIFFLLNTTLWQHQCIILLTGHSYVSDTKISLQEAYILCTISRIIYPSKWRKRPLRMWLLGGRNNYLVNKPLHAQLQGKVKILQTETIMSEVSRNIES